MGNLVIGGRRKTKAKHQQHITSTEKLSADVVLLHILPRLPGNSLCRFKFVKKEWYEFITTPEFVQMQLHHQNQNQNHHKLLLLSDTIFRTIDCEIPNKGIFSFDNVPLPFNAADYVLSVVKSLHGMVCVHRMKKLSGDNSNYSDLILWNPATGDYKTLSKTGYREECYYVDGGPFELYYSSSDNDYKLLHITPHYLSTVYIYSLKSDSWRKMDSSPLFRLSDYGSMLTTTALLNEKLYFLDTRQKFPFQYTTYSIIRFDTKTEKFTRIATPFIRGIVFRLSFLVLRGCIHLYFHVSDGSDRGVELWRMDGNRKGHWTKLVSAFPPWLQDSPLFLHSMRNENWLLFSRCDYNLYQVDVKKHTRKRLCALPEGTTIVEYMETLVSPNQYTK